MNERIAVVFGGNSNENEVSVITGTMAANVLAADGAEVLPVYISQSGQMYAGAPLARIETFARFEPEKFPRAVFGDGGIYLGKPRKKLKHHVKIDCVLNCCHGGWGEGGGISGLCAAAGLPLAGEGMFASSAFMDKYLTKITLSGLGVSTLPYRYVRAEEYLNHQLKTPNAPQTQKTQTQEQRAQKPNAKEEWEGLGFPVIVKPCCLGSSIGVAKAESAEELQAALETAFIYDNSAIVEKYVKDRREINCAAYRGRGGVRVSECEEVKTEGDVLSFEDKYVGGGRSVLPAELPCEVAAEIKAVTRRVYEGLNMRGLVRFDFILADKVYLSEVNTVPGSLAFHLFSGSIKAFGSVLADMIAEAENFFSRSQKKLITTGILRNLPSNACKTPKKQL